MAEPEVCTNSFCGRSKPHLRHELPMPLVLEDDAKPSFGYKHVSVLGKCINCGSECPNGRCPNIVWVGIKSHKFVGDGETCAGSLAYSSADPRKGEICGYSRKAEIHGEAAEKADPCSVCGREPQVMAFKKSGVCSELCRKRRDGDTGRARARA